MKFATTILLTLLAHNLFAQQTVVSPQKYANVEAPNAADVSGIPSYRFQQVYSASDFALLGEGPFKITRIDWRPGSEMVDTIDYPSDRFVMSFATTDVDPATAASAFDPVFANNINGNETLVFDGPITLTTTNSGPANGPKTFDYGLDLSTPYTFDPSAGNLLMDLRVENGQTPLLLDFINAPSDSDTTRLHFASSADAETSELIFGGHVLQFTVEQADRTQFFWDEFDRDDLFDSPLAYVPDQPNADYELRDGRLIVTSLADDLPIVMTELQDTPDFTLKTLARIEDVEICASNPFLALFGRDMLDGRSESYWGGIDSAGRAYIGEDPGGIRRQTNRFTCDDMANNSVHMELRIKGEDIEFTSWLYGTQKPDSPDLTMTDGTLSVNELVGVAINPSSQLEGFSLEYLALLPAIEGDFNASSVLDTEDIDLLSAQIRSEGGNRAFDLSGDAMVDQADRVFLISDLLNTWVGDSNLDGEFNSSDFVQVFESAQYEDGIANNSTWATGDWNGDGDFDSSDFVSAFSEGGYEKGPRTPAVPEPDCMAFWILTVIAMRPTRASNRMQ